MAECSSTTSNFTESLILPDNIDSLSGPEKLVICVDSACLSSDFKRILRNFLDVKCLVNRHEIALAVMTGTDVNMVCDFQTEARTILSQLWSGNRYGEQNHYYSQKRTFDLSKVFKLVQTRAHSSLDRNVSLRVIILYGRVNCLPILESFTALEDLQRDFPLFTLDVLYMPQYSVKCAKSLKLQEHQDAIAIFEGFLDICNEKSYVFAVDETANMTACVLKLLAHPALRQPQKSDWFE